MAIQEERLWKDDDDDDDESLLSFVFEEKNKK